MNGRQLADFGRAVRPDLIVLSITVCREGRDEPNRLEPGMAILTKPFAVDGLQGAYQLTLACGTAS